MIAWVSESEDDRALRPSFFRPSTHLQCNRDLISVSWSPAEKRATQPDMHCPSSHTTQDVQWQAGICFHCITIGLTCCACNAMQGMTKFLKKHAAVRFELKKKDSKEDHEEL